MSASSQRPGAPDQSPDDAFGLRLGQALRADLGGPVDVPSLLSGSRRRARTVRNRRIGVGTAAVILVIALPVTIDVLHGPDSAAPAAVLESGASRAQVAYPIPDSLSFGPSDLPIGLTEQSGSGQTTSLTPVSGLTCAAPASGDWHPVAGRRWTWAGTSSGSTGQITLTITGYSGNGQPAAAFAEVVSPSSRCRFSDPQTIIPGTKGWTASSTHGSAAYGRAVVRHGDLIAGVEVRGSTGTNNTLVQAQKLAAIALDHLSTSGLPPT